MRQNCNILSCMLWWSSISVHLLPLGDVRCETSSAIVVPCIFIMLYMILHFHQLLCSFCVWCFFFNIINYDNGLGLGGILPPGIRFEQFLGVIRLGNFLLNYQGCIYGKLFAEILCTRVICLNFVSGPLVPIKKGKEIFRHAHRIISSFLHTSFLVWLQMEDMSIAHIHAWKFDVLMIKLGRCLSICCWLYFYFRW